jgi:HlyD family secretion protein
MLRLLLNRRVLIGVALVGALLAIALWPETIPVDAGTVARGPLVVTVDEEGRTRVRHRYVVSAPVAGRVLRIDLEPGDRVTAGAEVARVQPEAPPLLDARTRAEAQATIETARAALGRAEAEAQRARAALALAQRELKRAQEMEAAGVIAPRELEARASETQVAEEAVNAASYAVSAARGELERAEARLRPTTPENAGRVISVASPIDGVVLRRLRESESVVPAGEPLLELGDPRQLEIVADLLSTDAVRVEPGARVLVEQWGGSETIQARVRRVEPSGFTKISALGVEEQRVNVVMDFADPAEAWTALGDGYRVEVRIVVWEDENTLLVPTSALFRQGEQWAVYVLRDDAVHITRVEIGRQTGQEAQVLSGLEEGTTVVVHPPDTLVDGVRVQLRN